MNWFIREAQIMVKTISYSAITLFLVLLVFRPVGAKPSATEYAQAIAKIETTVLKAGKTVATLGATRNGNAVVIDASGLMVTVGYLVVEAQDIQVTFNNGETVPAEVIVNDHVTGLALLRASLPVGIGAIALGQSEYIGVDEDVVVLKHGGTDTAQVTRIAAIKEFAGSWEYYIDRAFYTSPATRNFSGAALLNRDAKLVGIGSLLLSDIGSSVDEQPISGNLFIPIEHLTQKLGSLLAAQPSEGDRRPWLGASIDDKMPDLQVVRVAPGSPAEIAGLTVGDSLIAINGKRVVTKRGFYQALWGAGDPGGNAELMISREGEIILITAQTTSFDAWLLN